MDEVLGIFIPAFHRHIVVVWTPLSSDGPKWRCNYSMSSLPVSVADQSTVLHYPWSHVLGSIPALVSLFE